MKSLAIIGAGIAGITLARQLQDIAEVRVFEKSRGFGGRMATRLDGPYRFDHGAQFFTARSKQFRSLINGYVAKNQIAAWQPRVLTLDTEEKPFKREWFEPHYVAVPGMNNLCKVLAQELNVILDTRVANIEAGEKGWLLKDSDGEQLGQFDWVISSSPAPQADEVLPECFAYKSELSDVAFSPCFSLMLGFESAPKLNFDAAVVRNSVLGWIALNSSKQGRPPFFSLVVHSDNEWAQEQPEQVQDWIYNNPNNVTLAVKALDLYKLETGKGQGSRKRRSNRQQTGSAADMVSTKTTNVDTKEAKIWTESEIAKMSLDQFDRVEDEIKLALEEGRVRRG